MFLGNILPILADVGLVVVTGVVLVLGLIYAKQDSLLYIPQVEGLPGENELNPPGYRSPAEYNVPFETHMIPTGDGNAIHSWLLLHPRSKQDGLPTIVFFHGNAGNIGIRLPNALELYNLNANVLLVEYRGYGDSSPGVDPSEAGIKSDSTKALEFILNHPSINPQRVFIFGRSLGGAVGFHVAQHAQENGIPLAGLIVENTFVSIDRMVDALLPFLSPVKSLLLKNRYDSSKIASQLKLPILYLAGEEDEIVPHSQMMELYQSSLQSNKHATMHVVKGGMHNDSWLRGGKAYWNAIRDFMNLRSST
jgi:hypothetical protein